MAKLLSRLPTWAALLLVILGPLITVVSIVGLARVSSDANTKQDAELSATNAQLRGVSGLATDLSDGLEKANKRLEKLGAAPVPVPTATVPENGTNGDDGADGLDGAPGAAGPTGSPGPAGATGPAGPAGSPGPTGPAGAVGRDGPAGKEGSPGPTGATGPAGANGIDGQPGPAGSPPTSFTFDYLGLTYTCTDPEQDGAYTCTT